MTYAPIIFEHPDCGTFVVIQMMDDEGCLTDDIELSFKSRHVGGVHFLLMDGTVRFVSTNVDEGIRKSLGTRAGGEVPGEF